MSITITQSELLAAIQEASSAMSPIDFTRRPAGYFSAKEFAEAKGISRSRAKSKLKEGHDSGILEMVHGKNDRGTPTNYYRARKENAVDSGARRKRE